jgi:hypothetical protein
VRSVVLGRDVEGEPRIERAAQLDASRARVERIERRDAVLLDEPPCERVSSGRT